MLQKTPPYEIPRKPDDPVLRYRAVWISDIHLGTHGCQAEKLLDFLKYTESDFLYLVGDIIDGWQLRKRWYWPQSHNDVIQKILRCARNGSKIYFLPGNHDEFARAFRGLTFGGALVTDEVVHTTATGRRFIVLHGDRFDAVMGYAKWLAFLGDTAYECVLSINTFFNVIRRKMGLPYWSVSAYLKHKVKNAMAYISSYEKLLADEARRYQADGIICGHIHYAEMRTIGKTIYCNDGDWVESCTALVEDMQGELKIINWVEDREKLIGQALPVMAET